MVRAPCCEITMGLKKGPWTPEEDHILISYINTHGHGNWRALPKLAGLLRCGKSCRLRWTNYLRPDVKRGDFSKEEEETIIYMHKMLGNRWSAIAAKLPGRTDNEIKNFWHTHLKKRLNTNTNQDIKKTKPRRTVNPKEQKKNKFEEQNSPVFIQSESSFFEINTENSNVDMKQNCIDSFEEFPEFDEILWSEAFSEEEEEEGSIGQNFNQPSFSNEDAISFWLNLLAESVNLE